MPGAAERLARQRIVVTGLGAVSAWGWGVPALAQGLVSGETGIRPITRFDTTRHRTRIAGEVPPWPVELAGAFPEWRRSSWADRFALAATREALQAARVASLRGVRAGVFFASSTGGMFECEQYFEARLAGSPRARLGLLASQQLNAPGDAVARRFGVTGPVETVSSACASGALAVAAALQALRDGEVDLAITGGSDSLCQVTYAGFNALRAVDEAPCRPFRETRAGMSLGEGAAVLVLEREDRALDRGVAPLAEVRGAGASCDAHHMTAPHPEGRGAARALAAALADGRAAADAVGFVNAHGTGTPHNDQAEWGALRLVLGERAGAVPVVATKAAVGHLLGSAGAIEALATVLSLLSGELHPVAVDGAVDPGTPVDLVQGVPRPLEGAALAASMNLAFGGANAALLFAPWARP